MSLRKPVAAAVIAAGVTLLAGACTDVCGCPPELPELSVTVSGHVFAPDSTPVSGAGVAVEGGIDGCATGDDRLHFDDGRSEADGAYMVWITGSALDDDETVCVRARAFAPAGSGFGASAFLDIEFDSDDFYKDLDLLHDFYLTDAP